MATILPNGKQTFFDANGDPLSSGSVYFYIPGTTTAKDTWQDSAQTILNSNPVALDAAGNAVIYGSGAYRQIVKDSAGNLIWDQITADTSASQSSWAGTSGGSANAQTVSAANFTSGAGQSISFIAGYTNSGALTLNPNGFGPIPVLKDTVAGAIALTGGEVYLGNSVQVVYDATRGAFHLASYPLSSTFTTLTAGAATFTSSLTYTGVISPTALASNTNDWSPSGLSGASRIRLSASAAINLTGIVAQGDGRAIALDNVGSFDVTLTASDAASSAANRFILARQITLKPNENCVLVYDGASTGWRANAPSISSSSPVRQTVLSGPCDSAGLPSFLPATAVALSITSQNVTTTAPFVATSAYGFSNSLSRGALDRVGQSTANLTWSALSASSTVYLGVTIATDGTLTTFSTATAPVYQWAGTPSTTSGQYTYNINESVMYLGNGSTASQVFAVFVGEVDTSGSAVTATRAYAYRGVYEYTDSGSLPTTSQTKNHNIGVTVGVAASLSVINSTTELGYAVGENVSPVMGYANASAPHALTPSLLRNTVIVRPGAYFTWVLGGSTLTVASWRYRVIVRRLW